MAPPYGDGRFAYEPPAGAGVSITDLFSIVPRRPNDPDINSAADSQYPNVAIITPDLKNQFGGMWAKDQLDMTLPFNTEMYLHLGHEYGKDSAGKPADGMTFTLHNDPAGINALGGAGEGLGVYRGRKWIGPLYETVPHGAHLKNALVIEFDTYRNRLNDSAFVDDPGAPGTSHCSVITPVSSGNNAVITEANHRETFFFEPDQHWVKFLVTWTPNGSGGGTLNYSLGDQERQYTVRNIMETFKGTQVYWGFTGATGNQTAVQAAAIIGLPRQGITVEKTVENEAGEDIDHGVAFSGDTIRYTISATANMLIGQAGPIIIEDELSEFVDYVAGDVQVTTSSGNVYDITPTFSGNIMNVDTGQYLINEEDWIEAAFNVTVKNTAAGGIVYNKAVITATGLTEPHETNITQVTIFENPQKSISISSEAGQGGSAVGIGDKITYNISYGNIDASAATIIITDRLGGEVNFESASGGIYNSATHTVTWTIPDVPGGVGGVVSVEVSVNETASQTIENNAIVQVGAHNPYTTNTVINPVRPKDPVKMVSTNSEAGRDGAMVKTGDLVTYNVVYMNYKETAASVVVTDLLPGGVDFVSAEYGGIYDEATHTVSWTFPDVASGGSGLVTLVVRVNESAVVRIENYALMQVDAHAPLSTNIVVNPVSPNDPQKIVSASSAAGRGGAMVKIGDRITYDITYTNYQETAADIVITDKLSPGADFVSAANGGVYDETEHTVTWTLGTGCVFLTAKAGWIKPGY